MCQTVQRAPAGDLLPSTTSVLMSDGLGETMDFMPDRKLFRMTFSFVVALVLELCN